MTPEETAFRTAVKALEMVPSFRATDLLPNDIALLVKLYSEQPLPVDKIPHSTIEASMLAFYNSVSCKALTPYSFFGYLMCLRKGGYLPVR